MRRPALALLAPLLLLAACQQGPPPPPPTGTVVPTVAGGPGSSYGDLNAARMAFTRSAGSVTAVLEDASWIRLEGPQEEVLKHHRAYFDYGYTSFEVTLRSKGFSQPTQEEFLLEDSQGARVSGRPIAYQGAMKLEDNQWWTNHFLLAFHHAITADVRWIRLTRVSDGSHVEWTFSDGTAPAVPCAPPPPPVTR